MRQVDLKLLDVVALMRDMPSKGLCRGQVGTIVEELAPGVFEVEFSDTQGRSYAMTPCRAASLLKLHHKPFRS